MATFGRNKLNQIDGLFSRFLVSVPKDVFLMRKDISEAVTTMPSIINMEELLKLIFNKCKDGITIHMSSAALSLFDDHANGTTLYRQEHQLLNRNQLLLNRNQLLLNRWQYTVQHQTQQEVRSLSARVVSIET